MYILFYANCVISCLFTISINFTALSFILERKEGLLERSWVAGVTATEVMFAHVVAQCAVMIVQVALVLVFMIFVFGVPGKQFVYFFHGQVFVYIFFYSGRSYGMGCLLNTVTRLMWYGLWIGSKVYK